MPSPKGGGLTQTMVDLFAIVFQIKILDCVIGRNPRRRTYIIAKIIIWKPIWWKREQIYLCHKISGQKLKDIGLHFGIGVSGVSQATHRVQIKDDKKLNKKIGIILDLWKQGMKGRGDLFSEGRKAQPHSIERQLGLKIHPRTAP